jgi:GH15 family glucan-1,4-alpha-glucosidase
MARIEDYALLGDLQTAALVSTAGSIDWLCLPKFDSPACFAALLDTPDAGHWIVAPAAGGVCTRRRYVKDTLVLQTEWVSGDGTVRVIDFMPPRGHAPDVVRIVEGVLGSVVMRSELRLRCDYGLVVPWVRHHDDMVEAIAGPDRVRLRTPAPTRGKEMSTVSDFTVRAGDRVPFVLTWNPSHESPPKPVDAEHALRDTLRFWTDWAQRGNPVHGPYRDAIKRSLLTLKALTYHPTGGIVAAATTSLPELIGGTRNWDYRYCWLRDSTYTLQALISAGYLAEAKAWREWLLRAVAGDPAELQIMYALDGTRRIPEAELPWLSGYENSRPVRTGNAASDQLQLDVWGEILDSLALARNAGISTQRRRLGHASRADEPSGRHLGPARQRALGDARAPPALHPLQSAGLGRRRPDGHRGPRPSPVRASRPVGGPRRHHSRRRPSPRLQPRPQHLHAVL